MAQQVNRQAGLLGNILFVFLEGSHYQANNLLNMNLSGRLVGGVRFGQDHVAPRRASRLRSKSVYP